MRRTSSDKLWRDTSLLQCRLEFVTTDLAWRPPTNPARHHFDWRRCATPGTSTS